MLKNRLFYYTIAGAIALVIAITLFLLNEQNRLPYSLEIDAIKDKTDIAGTFYRVKVTNTGMNPLTGLKVSLGNNDIQYLEQLNVGESFFFYPKPDTHTTIVKVTTNENISKENDYRSPLKGIGLPGSGR